jgi:NADP-dependent 3-hydroxy acid dehydrogenase YdfG
MTAALTGKVALVTGASSGIGEAIAIALAQAGVTIALVARRADRLAALAQRIDSMGSGKALALAADMSVADEAQKVVEQTVSRLGKLDILINSAGVIQAGGVENCDLEEYRSVFDINLFATLYTSKAAIPHMLAGGGDIITISSLVARKGGPFTNAYAASKHAVNSMTDAMRQELGGRNIRVSILMPGATKTEVAENISDPKFRDAIRAHVGKEGAVLPSEVGDTVVFMLSLPRRVNISEISIRPTIDTTA